MLKIDKDELRRILFINPKMYNLEQTKDMKPTFNEK